MKDLKSKFINDLKNGSVITVLYIQFDTILNNDLKRNITAKYIKIGNIFEKIEGDSCIPSYIDMNEIEDNLEIFDCDFKKVSIVKIVEPLSYNVCYENELKVNLTKKEIEKILGYKIEIVEEN